MSDPRKVYEGDGINVVWDKRLCIHVGECGRATCDLFKAGRDPWCDPTGIEFTEIIDIVERCPTGAITYERKDGAGSPELPTDSNVVTVANNGPLYFRGELEIDGAAEDMPGTKFRAALCRCGKSANKPFCDNSHEKESFVDRGAIGDRGPGLEGDGGPLKVTRAKDGPLLIQGNLSLRNGSGQIAWQGTKAALCRCGQSKNKPFCDGAHKAAGFKAD